MLASVPEEARSECWWFVRSDGRPLPGDNGGGVALLAELRLTRPVGLAFRGLRVSSLVDLLDKGIARHRGRLGRLVPDGPAPRRYP